MTQGSQQFRTLFISPSVSAIAARKNNAVSKHQATQMRILDPVSPSMPREAVQLLAIELLVRVALAVMVFILSCVSEARADRKNRRLTRTVTGLAGAGNNHVHATHSDRRGGAGLL